MTGIESCLSYLSRVDLLAGESVLVSTHVADMVCRWRIEKVGVVVGLRQILFSRILGLCDFRVDDANSNS